MRLISELGQETLLWLPQISIFVSANEEPDSELQPEFMLSDYDIKSGSKYDAPSLDLFYRSTGRILRNDSCVNEVHIMPEEIQADPILWSKLVIENIKFQEKSTKYNKLLATLDHDKNVFA
ncbi:unnamed protein product [Trichobilharzia regenti]|nr:unnamed protein product [Trichobilharzia regenti]